jgi:uncharacterized protein (UPF0335 family)
MSSDHMIWKTIICLKKHNENKKEQEDNPFDYFLQSTAWLASY